MSSTWYSHRWLVCAAGGLVSVFVFLLGQGSSKSFAQGTGGASLVLDGTELLRHGQPEVRYVILERTSLDKSGFKEYKFDKLVEKPRKNEFDTASKTFKQEFSWGSVEVQHKPAKDRLDVWVTIRNQSAHTLANFEIGLAELTFPTVPTSWNKGRANFRNSLDDLAIHEATIGKAKLVLCNLTIDPPMNLGFDKANDKNGSVYPLVLKGGVHVAEPGAYIMEPHGLPRIPSGKSLKLGVTLRVRPTETPVAKILDDIFAKFREFHSPQHKWEDRRPIAMMVRASGHKGHVSATNPRGWLGNPKLNITTPEGKVEFRKALLHEAERSVKVIKDTGGQGMIFWDMEGEENPHPITFIGDPKLTKRLAPEMDECADAYFKIFRDAGLRTGVCIRPSQVYYDEAKKKWSHGTGSDGGPGRGDFYPQLRPKDQPWWKFYPLAERLSDRIDYAKKRWGCTLFYVDTNGVYRQSGEDQKFNWFLLESAIWKQVQAKHPDVLLILELPRDDQNFHAANWAYTAGYTEVRMKGYHTPDRVRSLFPQAFNVVVINDGDIANNRSEIKAGVARGDILMFRGWYPDERNTWVKALYDEVMNKK
jgi:hypothetical protein